MGNIARRPTAPTTVTQTIPTASVTTPVTTATTALDSTLEESNTQTDAQLASEVRSQSLLNRSRGRLGTVLTSFRGFLTGESDEFDDTQRKTLLGE